MNATFPTTEPAAPENLVREAIESWRNGARPDAAGFLSANPQVRNHKSLAMDLIYEEYWLRHESGEAPPPSTFCQKFPTYRQSLQRMLDVHQFMDAHPAEAEEKKWLWPQPGESVLGFQIVQKLGAGAIAKVYLAQQPDLGQRRVVVKVSRHGATEARLLGKLEHLNIVPIHSVHQDATSGLTCICMPFLGTATLVDLLDLAFSKGKPPESAEILRNVARQYQLLGSREGDEAEAPPILRYGTYVEEIMHLGVQLAEALASAHQAGVMHRDIKPSNVLLSRSGRPMLLDFNLSSDLEMPLERVGGTIAYMAPERIQCLIADQVHAESKLDPRSDVYSLGALLYELLCGELPSRPEMPAGKQARLEEWLKGRLTPPERPSLRNPAVDRSMDGVVLQALSPDPADRFSSAAEFAAALRNCLALKPRAARWIGRNRRAVLASSCGILAVLAISAAVWSSGESYEEHQFRVGEQAYSREDSKTAIDSFSRILEIKPNNLSALFARGQAYRQAKNWVLAQRDFQAAYEKSRNPKLLEYVGICQLNAGECSAALLNFEFSIKRGVSPPQLLHNIAYCLSLTGKRPEAVERLEELLVNNPDVLLSHHLCARIQLDQAYSAQNPVDERTKVHIQKALQGLPNDAAANLDAARIYAYSSKVTASKDEELKALQYLRRAIDAGISKLPITIDPSLTPKLLSLLSETELSKLDKRPPKYVPTTLYYEPPAHLSLPVVNRDLAAK